MGWRVEGRQWECLCSFAVTDKEIGGGERRRGEKVPFGPSSDLVRAKSISETPWSQTWHGAVSFPWLGCRYLPTIPQGHGASLSQLCSDSLAFHIMSAWSLLQQRGAWGNFCGYKHNQFNLIFFPRVRFKEGLLDWMTKFNTQFWNCKGMGTAHQNKRGQAVSRLWANEIKNWVRCRVSVVKTSLYSVH